MLQSRTSLGLDLTRGGASGGRSTGLSHRLYANHGPYQNRGRTTANDGLGVPDEDHSRSHCGRNCEHEQLTAMRESLPVNSPRIG